jgi:hypothetical protein
MKRRTHSSEHRNIGLAISRFIVHTVKDPSIPTMAPYSFTTSQKGGVRVVIPVSVKEEEKKEIIKLQHKRYLPKKEKKKKEPRTPDARQTQTKQHKHL